jgi:hypothetical protein
MGVLEVGRWANQLPVGDPTALAQLMLGQPENRFCPSQENGPKFPFQQLSTQCFSIVDVLEES